jgi:hypothetical protein
MVVSIRWCNGSAEGMSMRRISRLIAVMLSASLVFVVVLAREGCSATLLLRNYNNPDSDTMRLLNERHLDGII